MTWCEASPFDKDRSVDELVDPRGLFFDMALSFFLKSNAEIAAYGQKIPPQSL